MSRPFTLVNLTDRQPGRSGGDRGNGGGDNGGSQPPGPPGGNDMERRVAALETALPDLRERMVRIETRLESMDKSMVTKVELNAIGIMMAELKASVAEGAVTQTRWVVGSIIASIGLVLAAVKLLP